MAWVILVGQQHRPGAVRQAVGGKKAAFGTAHGAVRQLVGDGARVLQRAVGLKIVGGQAAAALVIAAVKLKIGGRTAPEELL